jgi:hypothetical protein
MWAYVNWIDAHRAMPARRGPYLVAVLTSDGARFTDRVIFDPEGPAGGWLDRSGGPFLDGGVTHWAEMPAPPPESIRDVLARERAVAAIDRGERVAVG